MKTVEVMVRSAWEFTLGLLTLVILLVGGNSFLLGHPMGAWPTALIIISPVIPVAFLLRSIIRLLQHGDELQRRIQLSAIGFSAASTGLLTFAYGLLEVNGYPPFPTVMLLPLMVILWVIGLLYFRWRFR